MSLLRAASVVAIAAVFAGAACAQEKTPPHAMPASDKPMPAATSKVGNVDDSVSKDAIVKRADFDEAPSPDAMNAIQHFSLEGNFAQGGLVFGQTEPGAKATFDGKDVMVDDDGRFIIGFGRDSALASTIKITLPDGAVEERAIEIADREFPVQRIDGLDQSKVSGFTEEQLKKIGEDKEKKLAARKTTQRLADWSVGFDWPATGRISGVFGSQRILNGEAGNPHSGVDVAVPKGTPILAPAPGVVRLAEPDMYFEGGLVLVDHGHWIESAFMHMSRIDVQPGQRVEKGDVLGAVGATGRATGPHLHWSLKWGGTLVDPQLAAGPMPVEAAPAAGE
ncbi:MAG: M23 family metallopeptidase [Parvularculaceae bacterium]